MSATTEDETTKAASAVAAAASVGGVVVTTEEEAATAAAVEATNAAVAAAEAGVGAEETQPHATTALKIEPATVVITTTATGADNPVVATEALAAAAAAAASSSVVETHLPMETTVAETTQPPLPTTTTTTTAAANPTAVTNATVTPQAAATAVVQNDASVVVGRVSILNDVDGQGKRRFFPRVKHLIGNKEWEDFLTQVLQCIEEAGAPETAAASHKANNAWYKAFDLIYGGVAREYSIPTGKNRYHKFKDKILEVWVALESQAPGENHCRDLAMDQYDRYKRACSEAHKTGSGGNGSNHGPVVSSSSSSNKAAKTGAGQSASRMAGGKRSYGTAMGGGALALSVSSSASAAAVGLWKNLDEAAVLKGLPEDLRSLVHLKQLSKEMAAGTGNRAARKGIEEHSKKLDGVYLEALARYLGEDNEKGTGSGGLAVVVGEGNNNIVKREEDPPDVEMGEAGTAGDDGIAGGNTDTETPSGQDNGGQSTAAAAAISRAYDRALSMAFLYRYASTLHEQKILAEAYTKYTYLYVAFPGTEGGDNGGTATTPTTPLGAAGNAVHATPAPATTATAADEGASEAAVAAATTAAAAAIAVTDPPTDEAAAAAAAAAAMEDPTFPVQI